MVGVDAVRLDGVNAAGVTGLARVADATTQNNCFPEFGDLVTEADPTGADVVAVIRFKDRSG